MLARVIQRLQNPAEYRLLFCWHLFSQIYICICAFITMEDIRKFVACLLPCLSLCAQVPNINPQLSLLFFPGELIFGTARMRVGQAAARDSKSIGSLTDHFTVLGPQNQDIAEFYVVQKRTTRLSNCEMFSWEQSVERTNRSGQWVEWDCSSINRSILCDRFVKERRRKTTTHHRAFYE